jgi:putative inorganic carbon (hco3(-)) transporter
MLIFLILIFIRPFICSLAFPYLNFLYSALLFIFLIGYIIYRKPLPSLKPALRAPLILFCLAALISVIFSRNQPATVAELYKYVGGMGLFLIGISLSAKERSSSVSTLILAATIISLLAFYQYLFSFNHLSAYLSDNQISSPFVLDYLQSKRVFLPFVTPGVLGGYLAMAIPLSLISPRRTWLIALLFFALVLTKSPVAFLSLFCGMSVYFCLRGKLKKHNIFLLSGILLLIVGIFLWRSAAQKEYLRPAFSLGMRLNYWWESLTLIRTHFFSGVGLGNFDLQNSRYAHNAYLQIFAEMGIAGLVSFVWLVFAACRAGFHNLKQSVNKKLTFCLMAACAVFLVHNILDFTFFLPEVSFIWWLILGLIAA